MAGDHVVKDAFATGNAQEFRNACLNFAVKSGPAKGIPDDGIPHEPGGETRGLKGLQYGRDIRAEPV